MRHDKTAVTTAPAKERKEAFMKGGVAVKRSRHATDLIFVLSLFCLFTVLSLFVVIQGADVYQGISREMSANYSARGTVAYLTEKVRQNDRENGVAVKEIGGEPALVFSEEIGGEVYETWSYLYGGSLREITVKRGTEIVPESGQPIMELKELRLELPSRRLLRILATDTENRVYESAVCLQSAALEVAP